MESSLREPLIVGGDDEHRQQQEETATRSFRAPTQASRTSRVSFDISQAGEKTGANHQSDKFNVDDEAGIDDDSDASPDQAGVSSSVGDTAIDTGFSNPYQGRSTMRLLLVLFLRGALCLVALPVVTFLLGLAADLTIQWGGRLDNNLNHARAMAASGALAALLVWVSTSWVLVATLVSRLTSCLTGRSQVEEDEDSSASPPPYEVRSDAAASSSGRIASSVSNSASGTSVGSKIAASQRKRRHPQLSSYRVWWDLFLYILMMICVHKFIFESLATTHDQSFYFAHAVREMLLKEPFGAFDTLDFSVVDEIEEVWTYLEEIVLPALYRPRNQPGPFDKEFFFSTPKFPDIFLIAGLTLRQLRVVNTTDCLPSEDVPLRCYPPFSKSVQDTSPFGPSDAAERLRNLTLCGNAFTYAGPKMWTQGKRFVTPLEIIGASQTSTYPSGGYVAAFPMQLKLEDTLAALDYLKSVNWIDQHTRALFLEVSFTNYNVKRWVITNLLFEFLPGGAVVPSVPRMVLGPIVKGMFDSVPEGDYYLIPEEPLSIFSSFYELVMPFALYFAVYGVVRLGRDITRFFTRPKPVVDIVLAGLAFASLIHRYSASYYYPASNRDQCTVTDLNSLTLMWKSARDMMGLYLIGMYLYSIRFYTLIPGASVIPLAVLRALLDVASFVGLFGLIFIGFASGFQTIYGSETERFRSFTQACLTLWQALLGQIDASDFITTSRFLFGVLLFIIFSFSILFVLLTMLIAIVGDSFDKTKERTEKEVQRMRRRRPPARQPGESVIHRAFVLVRWLLIRIVEAPVWAYQRQKASSRTRREDDAARRRRDRADTVSSRARSVSGPVGETPL